MLPGEQIMFCGFAQVILVSQKNSQDGKQIRRWQGLTFIEEVDWGFLMGEGGNIFKQCKVITSSSYVRRMINLLKYF